MFLWKGLQARTIALALTGKAPTRPAQGTPERARANRAATPVASTAGSPAPKEPSVPFS